MAYKASMQERFHRNFNSRIRTDANTLIRTTGIAANLEALYLFNGGERARPSVVSNLKQDTHHIDMTWNGDGYLLGDGGIKLADNGNAVLNTAGLVRGIDANWSGSKEGKSRVFVVNLEWKAQSISQCYIIDSNGFRFFRSAAGTVFTISMENQSTHRAAWTIDTIAFKDGDPVTIVVCGDYSTNTSVCYINGVSLGAGTFNGYPFAPGVSARPSNMNSIGRTSSWNNYYGFDGKIGLYGFSFNFPGNVPPTNAELKALSIDPYRVLLNTQRSKIDLPDILLPVASDWEIEFEARCDILPTNDNLMPLLTATDYAPNTQKGLSLQAAGNTAYGTIPGWICQYGTGSRWSVEVEFELTELSNVIHLLGASASTMSQFLRIEINGVIGVRNASWLTLQSTPGAIQANKRYLVKVAREDDTLAKLYIDDMITPVATCPIADIPTVDTDQIGRYSTTTHTPTLILYRLKFSNDSGTGSGPKYYSAEWNLSTIPTDDFALSWPSVGSTHDITITNPTVGIDPYYTKTPYMAGLFTNSAGQLVWTEGTNNYTTGGFAIATLWSGNSTRYLAMPFWTGAAASVWSLETEFMIYENNVSGTAWAFGIFTNNTNGFLDGRFVDASQTSFYINAKDSAGNVVATTPNIPFVLGKWYKVKIESTNADWVITVDDMEQVRVPSTVATPSIARLLGTTITPIAKAACRSLVTSGGTYSATWNTSNASGKGSVWISTNGQWTITHYGMYSNAYNWYDTLQRRFISESDVIIPQQRHLYKISKTGNTITVIKNGLQAVVVAWKQSNNMTLNRIANVSKNGIEYGQRLHLYKVRVGGETWIPNGVEFASSVSGYRNLQLSGVEMVSIPDPYIYCPTNGQTYTQLSSIPQDVIDLTDVVFEVSGYVRDISGTKAFYQTQKSTITVKPVIGQEFAGNIYSDSVAELSFPIVSTYQAGITTSDSNTDLTLQDIIISATTNGVVSAIKNNPYGTNCKVRINRCGVYSNGGYRCIDGFAYTANSQNLIDIKDSVVAARQISLRCDNSTMHIDGCSLVSYETNTSANLMVNISSVKNSIAILHNRPASSSAVSSLEVVNAATNDVTGTYGLFASLNDFVDPEYGDYRLKPESGLYKSGIGAFSPDYASPTTVYAETIGVLLSTPTMYGPYSYTKYAIDTSDDFSGNFSTSILVDASITLFSKESAITKPDTSSNVDLIMALAKEIGVAKPAISANFNIAATAAKEAGPSKPDTQINTDIAGLAATKEALTAITLLANISTSYLYKIIYDIGRSFSSLITVSTSKASTKSVNSVKAGTVANVDVSSIGAAKIANSSKQNVSASSDFVIGSGNKTPSASKPSTQVNVDALAAAIKDVGTVKVNSSVLTDIMSLASKEVGYQKLATSANVDFASFLYEISYGITGSFTSEVLASLVLQATKEALSQKTASSGGFSGIKVATKESSSQKPLSSASFSTIKVSTKAINSGTYSEISTSTEYNWTREAFSGIFTEISLSWEIFGTAKDIAKQIVLIDSDYQRVFEFLVNEVTKFNIDGDSTAYSLEYTTEGKINYLSYVGEDSQQTVTYTTKESKCLQ